MSTRESSGSTDAWRQAVEPADRRQLFGGQPSGAESGQGECGVSPTLLETRQCSHQPHPGAQAPLAEGVVHGGTPRGDRFPDGREHEGRLAGPGRPGKDVQTGAEAAAQMDIEIGDPGGGKIGHTGGLAQEAMRKTLWAGAAEAPSVASAIAAC